MPYVVAVVQAELRLNVSCGWTLIKSNLRSSVQCHPGLYLQHSPTGRRFGIRFSSSVLAVGDTHPQAWETAPQAGAKNLFRVPGPVRAADAGQSLNGSLDEYPALAGMASHLPPLMRSDGFTV